MLKLLLLASSALAANTTATLDMRVSTTSAVLARPVELTVSARLPAGVSLRLNLERSTTDSFAISKVEAGEVKSQGGEASQDFKLEIVPLALGALPVPLYWTAEGPGGSQELQAPPLTLQVADPPSFKADKPDLLDIKEPRAARPALWPWLLAAALGAAAWELYRRRKLRALEQLSAGPAPDDRPSDVIALAELADLEGSGAWDGGQYKNFYLRLTDILRRYLERRFGLPATRLTTAELYRHARQAELDRTATALFKDIFDRADLVKFAKIAPEADWGARDLAGARRLVEQTTPKPAVPAGAAEAKP